MAPQSWAIPTTTHQTSKGGRAIYNDFYKPDTKIMSSLVYTRETDAQVVSDKIRLKWISLGGGAYGVPSLGSGANGVGHRLSTSRWCVAARISRGASTVPMLIIFDSANGHP